MALLVACSVIGCSARTNRGNISNLSFQSFPSDPARRSLWIGALQRKHWTPTIHSKVCSRHFEESNFNRSLPKARLRPNAVPTLFDSHPLFSPKDVKNTEEMPEKQSPSLAQIMENDQLLSIRKTHISTILKYSDEVLKRGSTAFCSREEYQEFAIAKFYVDKCIGALKRNAQKRRGPNKRGENQQGCKYCRN